MTVVIPCNRYQISAKELTKENIYPELSGHSVPTSVEIYFLYSSELNTHCIA